MNFGYFWVFWRIFFFGYTGIPLPPWPTLTGTLLDKPTKASETSVFNIVIIS